MLTPATRATSRRVVTTPGSLVARDQAVGRELIQRTALNRPSDQEPGCSVASCRTGDEGLIQLETANHRIGKDLLSAV